MFIKGVILESTHTSHISSVPWIWVEEHLLHLFIGEESMEVFTGSVSGSGGIMLLHELQTQKGIGVPYILCLEITQSQ